MNTDLQIFYFLNSLAGKSPLLDGIIVFFATYLAYILIIIFVAFVFFSAYARREKLELLLLVGISTVVARFGVAELIRFFYHRPRPFVAHPQIHNLFTDSSWSFPSGHASFFFALATAVYFYNKKWGIGFFIATIFITLGRVIAGVHYPLDIIAGAIIGSTVAYGTYYFVRRFTEK